MSTCQRILTQQQPNKCDKPTDDPLCWDCLKLLRDTLAGLSEMVPELETQITKQSKGSPSVGTRSHEWKLPFDLGASNALEHVQTVLAHWYAESTDKSAHYALQGFTTDQRTRILIMWHQRHYVDIGRKVTAPLYLADTEAALAKAMNACDRKVSKIWIGTCSCGQPVHAYPNQRTMVDCVCGAQYNPAQSRRDLRVLGGEQLVTAGQAEKLGEVFGKKIRRQTVLRWYQRGHIECQRKDCTKGCNHLFRMGSVLVLHKDS